MDGEQHLFGQSSNSILEHSILHQYHQSIKLTWALKLVEKMYPPVIKHHHPYILVNPRFWVARSIFESNQLDLGCKQKLAICKPRTNHWTHRKSPTRKLPVVCIFVFLCKGVCFCVFVCNPWLARIKNAKPEQVGFKTEGGVCMADSLSVLVTLSNLSALDDKLWSEVQ